MNSIFSQILYMVKFNERVNKNKKFREWENVTIRILILWLKFGDSIEKNLIIIGVSNWNTNYICRMFWRIATCLYVHVVKAVTTDQSNLINLKNAYTNRLYYLRYNKIWNYLWYLWKVFGCCGCWKQIK
jgi:hypothetical protein